MDKLQRLINDSDYIVFFGGAGVSTESGIRDFRGENGLYGEESAVPPEEILSHSYFENHTEEFYRYYRTHLLCPGIRPNAAHKKLRELELSGKLKAVITQNIDGLHQAAGSETVLELHGSTLRNTCMACKKHYDLSVIEQSEGIPRCTCGGVIKPDVVLYDEALSDEVVTQAIDHIRRADLLIVAGTSLTVYPATGLLRYFHGKYLALINRDETPVDRLANYVSHDKVGEVLSKIAVTATIGNERMQMTISGKGAEAQSLTVDGKEQFWQDGGRCLWEGHSPVVFPICSSLKDDRYQFGGAWYHMEKHGFSRDSVFRLETLATDRAVFLLCDSEETRKSYPFGFEFRVEYRLSENKLITTYRVKNTGDGVMPVSFGSHEAYAADGITDYEIVFPEDTYLDLEDFEGGLLSGRTTRIELPGGILPLSESMGDRDSFVMKNHKSREVTLRKKDGTRRIRIEFNGIDYLVLWHVTGGDYICIEPWCSYVDRIDSDGDITKREGIMLLPENEEIAKTHTITFEVV